MSKLITVSFITIIFSLSGCSLPDYLDSVSAWFSEDKEATHSVAPRMKQDIKLIKKPKMDSDVQKIIQRYFRTHATGIYVHLDSIKRKTQKRKKTKNSQESKFAPPIAAPVEKVTRQNLP